MPVSRRGLNNKVKGGNRHTLVHERNGHVGASQAPEEVTPLSELETKVIYHKPIPNLPVMTDLQFELLHVCYLLASLAVQYVGIYKTNLHTVDYHLVVFISLILMRRMALLHLKQTLSSAVVMTTSYWLKVALKGAVLFVLFVVAVWSLWNVVQHSFIEDILFLCCPAGFYLWIFGITANPYAHKVLIKLSNHQRPDVQDLIVSNSPLLLSATFLGSSINRPPLNGPSASPHRVTLNGSVKAKANEKSTDEKALINTSSETNCCETEQCTLLPETVRYETESLRTDFNVRMKQAIFSSIISAYYVGFIPIKFTLNGFIFFDIWWSAQNTLLVGVNSFIMLISHLMPFSYLDGLYRCAMHLGSWKKYKGQGDTPYVWSGLNVWPQSIVVKHNRCLYKAVGRQNSATPGDSNHARFYYMFQTPLRLLNWLLLTQFLSVAYQLYELVRSFYWYQVLSLVTLLPFHYFILFILLRQKWAVQANLEEHEACGS